MFRAIKRKAQLKSWAFFLPSSLQHLLKLSRALRFFLILTSSFLVSCSHTSTPHWQAETLQTPFFTLYSEGPPELLSLEEGVVLPTPFPKAGRGDFKLTIVIEGDGYAWVTRSRPSSNPTPKADIARQIAYHLPNAVYLARPCQYVWSENCEPLYWTSGRFHSKVVESLDAGIDQLKKYYHAKHVRLIGYSGGGVLAGLIAARRQDVIEWVSVASPLDQEAWIHYHEVSPLDASLSLKDYQKQLENIPQIHYVGGEDLIVPWSVEVGWATAMRNNPHVIWHVIPGYRHSSNWSAVISPLLQKGR